jgi:hypothetical protein
MGREGEGRERERERDRGRKTEKLVLQDIDEGMANVQCNYTLYVKTFLLLLVNDMEFFLFLNSQSLKKCNHGIILAI